eukprot:11084950-Alexandrium_andersonii.AAC.1
MLRVLKASAGKGVAKAKVPGSQMQGGGIDRPHYPVEGVCHAWRFAGPPVGGVGRGAYADLREFLSAARWVATEPGE